MLQPPTPHLDPDDGPYDGWQEDEPECPNCHGDGMDPWNDYLFECPLCMGGRLP